MPDATELLKVVKRAALEAQEAGKPVALCFGQVASVSPLTIRMEQKLSLGEAQITLPQRLTDFPIEIEGIGKTTVKNGLAVGDDVILFRQQGGQRYIVLDRVGK